LHEFVTLGSSTCKAPSYIGVGFIPKLFPPHHPFQAAAKKHDWHYEHLLCGSTKEIDKEFYRDCIAYAQNYSKSDKELRQLTLLAKKFYRIVRLWGTARYLTCSLKKWKYLLKKGEGDNATIYIKEEKNK
jgi:hypothetical protein